MIEIFRKDETLARMLPPVRCDSNTTYIPSQYALAFEHCGKSYIFNSLTRQLVESVLPHEARIGEGFDELIDSLFLVPADKDECTFYNQISSVMRTYYKQKGISTYTILPTFACNARCVYCYEEGMKQVTMTDETVTQTIRFMLDTHRGEKIGIRWFGGEPLLGEKIIDRICESLREEGVDYASEMISNGSLITPAIIEKMAGEWRIKRIQISMDGAEEDYITRKHYYRYRNDYHRVMESVSAISESGIAVSVRCNVDEDNWENIPLFLRDMEAGISNKKNVTLYFAPLNSIRLSDRDYDIWKKIMEARPAIEAAGFKSSSSVVFRRNFRMNHCMADAGSVVITPDGGLNLCEHCPPESRYGDIWHGITNESARREFCRVDRTREKCRSCPFLPNCTSFAACPVVDTYCREIQEMLTIDLLKRLIEKREENRGEDESIC